MSHDALSQAKHIASKGYRCLIPDLYRGKIGLEAEEAHHLMSNLEWPGAVADIAGAAAFLRQEGSKKVGVAGFCMGGALAIAAAVRAGPELLDAAVPFYGTPSAQVGPAGDGIVSTAPLAPSRRSDTV